MHRQSTAARPILDQVKWRRAWETSPSRHTLPLFCGAGRWDANQEATHGTGKHGTRGTVQLCYTWTDLFSSFFFLNVQRCSFAAHEANCFSSFFCSESAKASLCSGQSTARLCAQAGPPHRRKSYPSWRRREGPAELFPPFPAHVDWYASWVLYFKPG